MINSLIGKYKITRLVGEGGMASVYEAVHEVLGTKAAVKVLNPILSANQQIRERFKNEAILMASLDHPNITKVIDFDEQPQQLTIVMEFLQGEDLNRLIKRQGPLSESQIKSIFSQALLALQYAHEKGIVHRDIKPSNIYVLPNGQVKILDFGIAKLFGQGNEMTQTGTQIGTPVYMSPEQVKADKSIDHRSDIYSLGVTLFFAINGKPPYNAETHSQFDIFSKIVYEPLPEISGHDGLNDLVKKACSKDRANRFQSCQEWTDILNQGKPVMKPASATTTKSVSRSQDQTVIEPVQHPVTKDRKGKVTTRKKLFKLLYLLLLIPVFYFGYLGYKNSKLSNAIELFNKNEYAAAYAIFDNSMFNGNSEAQYYLAKMYSRGLFVSKSPGLAFSLAEKSSEQGNVKGMNLLGILYKEGMGTTTDIDKAKELFQLAGEKGNPKGFGNLGELYMDGKFKIDLDYTKALSYFEKAIDIYSDDYADYKGLPQYKIGVIYRLGGHGVSQDYTKAKDYYLKAIELKNASAAVDLGWMYQYGNGVEQSYSKAFEYYTIAADRESSIGQNNLGTLYLDGNGCVKDEGKALELFKKSADQNNSYGLRNLGWMYEQNLGGAGYNLEKAKGYYRRAADLGNDWARDRLKYLNDQ